MKCLYKIVIILAIIVLFACNGSFVKTAQLKQKNKTNTNDTSYPNFLKVVNNKLYACSSEEACVFEYDLDLNKIKSFGKKGKGPQEFANPFGLAKLDNERMLMNDIFNFRLAILNQNGVVDSTFKYTVAFYLANDEVNNKTLVQRSPFYTDTAIFEYIGNELVKTCDVAEMVKQFNLKSDIWLFTAFDDEYFICYSFATENQKQRLFKYGTNKQFEEVFIENLPETKHEFVGFGGPKYHNGSIYIPYNSYSVDYAQNPELKNLQSQVRILKLSTSGKIQKIFEIPDNIYMVNEAWDIYNNTLYLFDLNRQEIYSYEIPI